MEKNKELTKIIEETIAKYKDMKFELDGKVVYLYKKRFNGKIGNKINGLLDYMIGQHIIETYDSNIIEIWLHNKNYLELAENIANRIKRRCANRKHTVIRYL